MPILLRSVLLAAATSTLAAQTNPPLLASTSRSFSTGDQEPSQAYRPYEVAVADLDGDGRADLALAHYGNFLSPKVSWLRNAGDGTFEAPRTMPASGDTMDVVARDLDGDGDVDLAFAQSSEGTSGQWVLVFLNDGPGRFAAERRWAVGNGPTGIAAGDVDGDGDVDLVTANTLTGEDDVSVLYNDGLAGFAQRQDFAVAGHQPRRVELGDLTGDGRPEIVASLRGGSPDFAVWTNDGSGGFGVPALHAAGYQYVTDGGVAVADVDNDGDRDVLYGAMASGLTSSVALFRNVGAGVLGAAESLTTAMSFGTVYDFAVADVTGDGWPDVLGTGQSSGYGYVLVPSTGNGRFGASRAMRTGEMARAVATSDLDGDGDQDVVVVNSASLTVTVHTNENGALVLPPQVPVPSFSKESDVGDVDGDGDVDLVTASGTVSLLTNQGGGNFTTSTVVSLGTAGISPRLRELSGDGRADLAYLHGQLHVALAHGAGGFGAPQAIALGGIGRSIDALDADGDGDRDLVVAGALSGHGGIHYVQNLGAGTFAAPVFQAATATSVENHVRSGDFDNDRIPDVLTASSSEVRVWLGNGDGTFRTPIVTSLGAGGTGHVTVADLDGDGNLDVAASASGSTLRGETLSIAFGYGDGDFAAPQLLYAMFSLQYAGAAGLDHLDVDGDGDRDLVAGVFGAEDVEVFLNRGNRTFERGHRYGVDGGVTGVRVADFDGDGAPDVFVNLSLDAPTRGAIALLRNRDGRLGLDDLGLGLAGSQGVPTLGATGTARGGQPFALHLRRALPNAPLALVLGATRVDVPLFGGTLVPAPTLLVPMATGPLGSTTLAFPWPRGLPAGGDVLTQGWIADPAGVRGFAASNGLRVRQL